MEPSGTISPDDKIRHAFINITITPEEIAKNLKGHNYSSILRYNNLSCDTGPNPKNNLAYCSDGRTIQLPEGATAVCGGWGVPRQATLGSGSPFAGKGQAWVPTWGAVDGFGCFSTKPKTWCPCRTCLYLVMGAAAYGFPCYVDCSYKGC
jgi:hypothetical protein